MHSNGRFDCNDNNEPGKGLREPAKAPQEYEADIVRHLSIGSKVHYGVWWYGSTSADGPGERHHKIRQHSVTGYWLRVQQNERDEYQRDARTEMNVQKNENSRREFVAGGLRKVSDCME